MVEMTGIFVSLFCCKLKNSLEIKLNKHVFAFKIEVPFDIINFLNVHTIQNKIVQGKLEKTRVITM